jgi:FAD-dependent urate hydroxylase
MTRIAIVGYGIAGIAAALFLRRQGHRVVHFEQAAVPAFAGGGLLLQATGLSVLAELGLREAALARGTAITRITARGECGTIMDLDASERGAGLGIQRGALFALMRDADTHFAELLCGRRIVQADAERGVLTAGDGTAYGPFDLVVGADGAHSVLRGALAEFRITDRLYPTGALLCLLDDPGRIFASCVSQHFQGGRHIAVWPVGTLAAGAPPRINLSWRAAGRELDAPVDAEYWKEQALFLCPELGPLLRQVRSAATLTVARYRQVHLRRSHLGRLVLLGDAAHSMSPQLGQGASMALLDARALAHALAEERDPAAALAAYDRARRGHIATYRRLSRLATPLFQSDHPLLTGLRNRAVYPVSWLALRALLDTLSGRGPLRMRRLSPESQSAIM